MTEREIFVAALDQEGPARDAYLAQACAGDPGLRLRIESLLAAHERARSFLESPAAEFTADHSSVAAQLPSTLLASSRAEGPGTRIGPYKLLQQIGEGGMGIVYMAEQERPVRRKVALKIIKPGM